MAKYGLPADEKILAVIGKIALRQGQVENTLRRIIGDLAGVTVHEALDATTFTNTRELRLRARKLAKQRFGDGALLLKLDAVLERARKATDNRNELIHSTWGIENGVAVFRNEQHEFVPIPTLDRLEELFNQLSNVLFDLGTCRIEGGFIYEALKKAKKLPKIDPDGE